MIKVVFLIVMMQSDTQWLPMRDMQTCRQAEESLKIEMIWKSRCDEVWVNPDIFFRAPYHAPVPKGRS